MAGESEFEGSRVSHLSSPALMRTTYSCGRRSAKGAAIVKDFENCYIVPELDQQFPSDSVSYAPHHLALLKSRRI